MKLTDIKDKIDSYFENVSANEIINNFYKLGYEFEPIVDVYEINVNCISDKDYFLNFSDEDFEYATLQSLFFVNLKHQTNFSNEKSVYNQNELVNYNQAA